MPHLPPNNQQVNVRMPAELHEAAVRVAAADGRTFAGLVRHLLTTQVAVHTMSNAPGGNGRAAKTAEDSGRHAKAY